MVNKKLATKINQRLVLFTTFLLLLSGCAADKGGSVEGSTDSTNKETSKTEGADTESKFSGDSNMVFVKGGSFQMGSNSSKAQSNEQPVHTVTVSDFYISKYEVTQKQWKEVMGSNPSNNENCDECPVEKVSWDEVQTFIKKLNARTGNKYHYRLPTEAEWEYAARGGKKSKSYKYIGSDNLDEVAWYGKNSYEKGESHKDYGTHPVGQKLPNELGLYDMSGNVAELCSDWYDNHYYQTCKDKGTVENPAGAKSGRNYVRRGGNWQFYDWSCRATFRSSARSSQDNLGFRLAGQLK